MSTKAKKPTFGKSDRRDVHLVVLTKRGFARTYVLRDGKAATDLALGAMAKGWKRAEATTFRPWSDGEGYARLGRMIVTPNRDKPADSSRV